jgi:hypothetical protein
VHFATTHTTNSLTALSAYRFHFNGGEAINEVYGNDNYVDLGERGVDTRLGRLNWSIDPRAAEYPWQSPYAYYANSPIWQIDYLGMGDDNYTIHEDGTVDREITDDKTDNFKYEDKNGNTTDLGTYDKLDNGLIKVPEQGAVFTNNSNQTSPGKDRNYVDPKIFAGILGAGFEYKNETGLTMQINQLNDKDGGHSGHKGTGGFADIRYANTKGNVNESVWTNGKNFDLVNSQLLANKFTKFGFNQPGGLSILTENAQGNGPALINTRFVDGKGKFHHKHHMHLQRYNFTNIKTIVN